MSYSRIRKIASGKPKATKLYRAWENMKSRCTNQNHKRYKDYGGRGIAICDEWQSFDNFRNWAMKNGVRRGLTIDRIDNDGNYEPGNCRWVTSAVQSENSSSPIFIEFNGLRLSQRQWAKHIGLSQSTMWYRLKTWTLEDALTRPKQARYLTIEGMGE